MHECDKDTSLGFIDSLADKLKFGRALDCGAGIGRVTKHVLLERYAKVDIVEPSSVQIAKAKEYIGSDKVEK